LSFVGSMLNKSRVWSLSLVSFLVRLSTYQHPLVLWESARSPFISSSEFLLVGYLYAISFHKEVDSILPVPVKWYPRLLWHSILPPNLIHTVLILSQLLAVESSVTDFRYSEFNFSDTYLGKSAWEAGEWMDTIKMNLKE